MFKSLRFLSLLLAFFLVGQLDGGLQAAQYVDDLEYISDQLNIDRSKEGLAFGWNELADDMSIDEIAAAPIDELFGDGALGESLDPSKIYYILYARPGGILGTQLDNFWSAVINKGLKDPPVQNYPYHVTLTGFFPLEEPNEKAEEKHLIAALESAIYGAPKTIPITFDSKISTSSSFDYISIKSPAVHAIAVDFLDRAGLDPDLIRPKPKAKTGYHISLREDTDASTTAEVRKLEKSKINLTAPNIQKNTTWALYLYKKLGKKWTIIYSQPIKTQ